MFSGISPARQSVLNVILPLLCVDDVVEVGDAVEHWAREEHFANCDVYDPIYA